MLGPPGSGKTTLLVERYRALVAQGHKPLVIAFGREQRDRLLERVIPPGGAYLGASPVTTHGLMASAILDAAHPRRPRTLRDVDELLILGRILRREPELLTSDLSAIAGSATFQRHLIEALHALAQNDVSEDDARACERVCADPRARDVLRVYARYRERCVERGLVSFYDAAWRAAECIEASRALSPLSEFDAVLIDDFHDLDPGQYRLLTRLVPPGGRAKLEVFGDSTGPRFSFRGTSDRFLHEDFPRDYAPIDVDLGAADCSDAALRDTVAALIAETSPVPNNPPAASPVQTTTDLPLFAAASAPARDEARSARPQWDCVASHLVAADEIAEAQTIAARVRVAIDAGTEPRDIAVITRDTDRYRSVIEIACHEWGVPLDAGGMASGAADDFLRTLLGALGSDVDGRFADALTTSPFAPLFFDGKDAAAVLRALSRDGSSKDGFQFDRLLAERVLPLFDKDDVSSQAALATAAEEWRRYRDVVEHAGGGTSVDEFRAIYLGDRGARPRSANRVALLSAREATGRSFHSAFVCGCAEGFFPGPAERDGYIPLVALARALARANPDAARHLAARLDEREMARAEHALLLTALTRATHALTITVPERIGGETTMPARPLGVGTSRATTNMRRESPCARSASAVAVTVPDGTRAQRLRAIDTLAGWWVTPPSPERWPAFADFSMSASKLNSYARCARQFFYRNVLRIDEPESIYLRVGSLVHEALKEIIQPGATRDEIRAALRDAGTRAIAERLVSHEFADVGVWMRELSVKYLDDMLRHVAELEADRVGNYSVRMLEEEVEGEVEGMRLRGRIDRVDEVEGVGAVVIDYKVSGSVDKTYKTLLKKMEQNYWQVPVYALMARFKDILPTAFVYYVLPPGDDSFAVGVQLAPGARPAPIPTGTRQHSRYGDLDDQVVADAMARAVEIHRTIVEGECRYERTEYEQNCPKCHYARICQRSRASI